MRKRCGPARPGLTGHTGKIIPSYSDGLFSTYQATIFPIPPTTCHSLLHLWSQERRTRSVQRQAEMMRRRVRPVCPSRKDTPAKGCMLLTTSWLTSAFQPKKTYLVPLPPSWCSPGWRFTGDSGCPCRPEPGSSSQGFRSSFPTKGLGKWSGTCSALVQEIPTVHLASCHLFWRERCSLGEGSFILGASEQGVSLQRSATSLWLDKTRHVCPLL